MTGPARPLLATATWDAVMAAAGGRCTCAGACGTAHIKDDRRCPRSLERGHRLYAAPADPAIPTHAAWQVPAEELTAWCGTCLDAAQRTARRTTTPTPDNAPGLFDLPTAPARTRTARAARAA